MPQTVTPYPPGLPSISGNLITVDMFLRNPARVQRTLTNLALQRFISDVIFAGGPQATGGAVVHDQLTANDLFLDRDAQSIQPGAEYPILTDSAPIPLVAAVTKWGGRVFITDEARDRNSFDAVVRALRKLNNTVVRKVDSVAIAVLQAAPILQFSGAVWSNTANDVLSQLTAARLLGDVLDMGYDYDTLLLNPASAAAMLGRKDLREAFGPTAQEAIVRGGNLGRILSYDVIQSNRVPAGKGFLVARKVVGSISDEVPYGSKTYRQEDADKTWIQGARRAVPYVTDPKAAIQLNGI